MPQIIPPIVIPVPRFPHLAPDRPARPRSTDQADADPMAEKALRTTLLAAQATELAIGPPETLRDLFTRARQFLPHRH
jgi:hypothetical protein